MVPAVDVVAEEDVVRVGTLAADAEQLLEVEKLAVDIAADGDRRVKVLDVALVLEELASFIKKWNELLLVRDLDQIRCSICKLQCVIPDAHREQALIRSLRILKMERTGSLLTLTVRGEREETVRLVQAQEPLFFEVLPLTLEEIFISETEVAGYDIKDFLH